MSGEEEDGEHSEKRKDLCGLDEIVGRRKRGQRLGFVKILELFVNISVRSSQ
jgi:hypothetical protein